MKIIRETIQRLVPSMRSYIDEPGGGSEPSLEAMTSALSGDYVENVPQPEDFIEKGAEGAAEPGAEGKQGAEGAAAATEDLKGPDAWAWSKLKENYSSEENPFEIPKEIMTGKKEDGTDLSDKERFDLLVKTVSEKSTPKQSVDEDDFIRDYKLARASENFKKDEFIKSQMQREALFQLEDKSFYEVFLASQKKEDGTAKFSEQDIKDHLSKMNAIELEERVSGLKDKIKAQVEQNRIAKQQEIEQIKTKQFEEWDTNRKSMVSKTLEEAKALQSLAGLPIGEAEIKAFEPIFDHMTSFNPETGQLHLDDYLQSKNLNVFSALYLMHQIDGGGMEKHFSNMKEDIKAKILDKTGVKPNLQSMGGGSAMGIKAPSSSEFH